MVITMLTRDQIIEAIKTVKDPDVGMDIWTMGLIYDIKIAEDDVVEITMTLTTPMCPAGPQLTGDVQRALYALGAKRVAVEITFDPPWTMSDELRTMLGV